MNRYAPVFALALLAPFIAEFLFGATPISRLGGFVFLVLLYGGGAVLIRELARRRSGTGWGRIAVLGAAYALIEEGLAVQSFFNPDLFQAGAIGGRALGVNWVWSEWTVGYHILWSLLIPILLAELLFPDHRTEPWLKNGGLAVAGVCFALGVGVIGIAFRRTIAPTFRAPAAHLAVTALAAAVMTALALAWPNRPSTCPLADARRSAPSPWLLGLLALVTTAACSGCSFSRKRSRTAHGRSFRCYRRPHWPRAQVFSFGSGPRRTGSGPTCTVSPSFSGLCRLTCYLASWSSLQETGLTRLGRRSDAR